MDKARVPGRCDEEGRGKATDMGPRHANCCRTGDLPVTQDVQEKTRPNTGVTVHGHKYLHETKIVVTPSSHHRRTQESSTGMSRSGSSFKVPNHLVRT